MIKSLCFAVAILAAAPVQAGPAEDASVTVANVLDKFNAGDISAFVAAHRDGALIVDEFAPYLWGGSGSATRWLEDYGRDAADRGISGGRVDHGKPVQAASDGRSAYIVIPATYRFDQKGVKMAGSGSMTFVLFKTGDEWKIASWIYSGSTPAPE